MKHKDNTQSQKTTASNAPRKNKSKKHDKQQDAAKRRQAEANARRKVAKEWDGVAKGRRYQKAAVREACNTTTLVLIDELFDGILLELNERNCGKSLSVQKRILRRIVEKRQAQSAHNRMRRTGDGLARHLLRTSVSNSMKRLHRHQFCA